MGPCRCPPDIKGPMKARVGFNYRTAAKLGFRVWYTFIHMYVYVYIYAGMKCLGAPGSAWGLGFRVLGFRV